MVVPVEYSLHLHPTGCDWITLNGCRVGCRPPAADPSARRRSADAGVDTGSTVRVINRWVSSYAVGETRTERPPPRSVGRERRFSAGNSWKARWVPMSLLGGPAPVGSRGGRCGRRRWCPSSRCSARRSLCCSAFGRPILDGGGDADLHPGVDQAGHQVDHLVEVLPHPASRQFEIRLGGVERDLDGHVMAGQLRRPSEPPRHRRPCRWR